MVTQALEEGAVLQTPNGLPPRCLTNRGTLLIECEDADHPDYKFPVNVEWAGHPEDQRTYMNDTWFRRHRLSFVLDFFRKRILPKFPYLRAYDGRLIHDGGQEIHALIYSDGGVAVTVYETCYTFWDLHKNTCMGGHLHAAKMWRLSEKSLKDARAGKYHHEPL